MSARPNPIGDHTPRDVLARSVFGTLWDCAKDNGDASSASLRIVDELTPADAELVEKTMKVAMSIDDGACIGVRDVVVTGAELAIVSAPFDGTAMRDVLLTATIKRKLLPLPVLVRVASDMLTALAAVHAHADSIAAACGSGFGGLSPDSFVLCRDGVTRFIEPGLGTALSHTKHYQAHAKRLGYDAPEVLQGDAATARSDVFSVAAMLWELLVGRRMLPGSNLEAMQRRLSAAIPKPSKRPKGEVVPSELAEIVSHALALDPADRYADALEMATALEDAGGLTSSEEEVASALEEVAPKRSIRPPAMAAKAPRAIPPVKKPSIAGPPKKAEAAEAAPGPKPPPRRLGSSRKQLTRNKPPAPPPRAKARVDDELDSSDLESVVTSTAALAKAAKATTGAKKALAFSKPSAFAAGGDIDVDLDLDASDDEAPDAQTESTDDKADDREAEASTSDAKAADAAGGGDADDADEVSAAKADDDDAEASDAAAGDAAADGESADDDDASPAAAATTDAGASAESDDDQVEGASSDEDEDATAGDEAALDKPKVTPVPRKVAGSSGEDAQKAFAAGPVPEAASPKSVPPQKVLLKGKKPTAPDPRARAKTIPSIRKATDGAPAASSSADITAGRAKVESVPPAPLSQGRVLPLAIGAIALLAIILYVAFGGKDAPDAAATTGPNTPTPPSSSPAKPAAAPAPTPPPAVEPVPEPEPTTADPDPEPEPPTQADPTPATPSPNPTPFPTPPAPFPRKNPYPKPAPKPTGDYIPPDI